MDIAAGDAHLELPSKIHSFWGWTDAVTNLAFTTANVTNPRYDTVVAWVDTSVTNLSQVNSPGSFKFKVIAGTAAGSPTVVNDASIQANLGAAIAWLRLADVLRPSGVDNVTNTNIADTRTKVTLISAVPAADRPHYNSLYLSTGGASGGYVIPASTQTWASFDVADTAHSNGITATTGSNAYMTIQRDGNYSLSTQWNASGGVGSSSFIQWWYFSFDNGASWTIFRESDRVIGVDTSGPTYTTQHWLPAGARVRVDIYNGGNALRVGSSGTSFNSRFYAGPKFSVMEVA